MKIILYKNFVETDLKFPSNKKKKLAEYGLGESCRSTVRLKTVFSLAADIMSNYTNPFTTIGDYRGGAAGLADPEEVSYSYLTGLPNVRTLSDPQVTMIFKNLLKKDAVTRERALTEFAELVGPDFTVDEETHLAFVQIYAKFSIDVSPSIRQKSHSALKALYGALGRRSAKHLQSSVGPWLSGTHDPDPAVSSAAEDAWNSVFPDKKQLVLSRMREHLIEFVAQVLTTLSPTSISDIRYVSKDDANQKYYRVVKTAVDIVARDLSFDDSDDLPAFLQDDSIWKFLASKSAFLIKSILALGNERLDKLSPEQLSTFWKHLLKALRACPAPVSVELLKTVITVTELHPNVWQQSESVASLAQFVVNAGNHPRQVWPLLFNLVVEKLPSQIGLHNESTASVLLKSIKKVLSDVVGEAEGSAWGCYLALCTKPNASKYVHQAVEAVAKRCERLVLPPLYAALASRFKDFSKFDGVEAVVAKCLVGNAGFAKLIASTGLFENELEKALSTLPPKAVSQIVAIKPNVTVDTSSWESGLDLLEVAVHSESVDRQDMINRLLPEFGALVLERAGKLKGVEGDLSDFVDESSAASLRSAVLAHGTLIPEAEAKSYFTRLCSLAEADENAIYELGKAVSEDENFCVPLLLENEDIVAYLQESRNHTAAKILDAINAKDSIEQLCEDLRQDVDLTKVDSLISRAVKLSVDPDSTRAALLCDTDWLCNAALFVESTSQWIYEIDCWHLAEFEPATNWLPTFVRALYLLRAYEEVGDKLSETDRTHLVVKLLLVASACVGRVFIDSFSDVTETYKDYVEAFENPNFGSPLVEAELWELTKGKDAKAYHATQVLCHFMEDERLFELARDCRHCFATPSFRGAMIAQNSAISGAPWYDRYQYDLLNDLNLMTIPLADVSIVSDRLQEKLLETILESTGALFVEKLKLLHQLEYYPSLELVQRALEGDLESQFAILQMIDPGDYATEVASAAARLQPEQSQFDCQVHGIYLKHAKGAMAEHAHIALRALYNLIEMDSETLPWIGYGYLHHYVASSYREKLLSSNLEDTAFCPHIQRLLRDSSQEDNKVVWLLFMEAIGAYVDVCNSIDRKSQSATTVFGEWEDVYKRILEFVADQLEDIPREDLLELRAEKAPCHTGRTLAVHLLYSMSLSLGVVVRNWYREVRDRKLLKAIDDTIQFCVLPAVLRTVSKNAREMRDKGQLEGTSVSEQLREFRAQVDFDEHVVDVVIRLPNLYPAKSATVEIKNLVGVPEAKRRAWVLEAEFNVQNGAIIGAMKGLLLKLSNFLDGVEPCAICYQVVLNGKQLPNKTCSTCHNTYHADCLFKWFNSNKTKLCPMCRSSF